MAPPSSRLRTASNKDPADGSAVIEVSAHGNRRSLEAIYLELCQLAKDNGLKVEYQLTRKKPEDPAET